jgi:hypothetical protein
MVRRGYEHGVAAYNRKDYDALLANYSRYVEVVVNEQMRALGLEPVYVGHKGLLRYHQSWTDEWGDWKMTAEEVFDLGDGRFLMTGRVRGQGGESGAATDSDFGLYQVYSHGVVGYEQFCFDRDEAFRAAGMAVPKE